MAEFNPRIKEDPVPMYTSASRGLDYQANRKGGIMLEGFGKAFDGLIKGLDESVQENIRQDTQKGFDAINKEFGVDAAAVNGHPIPGPNSIADQTAQNQPLPETIQRAGDQLRSLSQAAAQNPNLERHFGERMYSMVRQLRGKYPGYRTQIDEIVSSVTGMRPANYLRNEIFQEIQRGTTQAQKSYSDAVTYARNHGYLGGLQFSGNMPIDPDTKQPLTIDQLQVRIANGEAQKAQLTQQNAELERDSKLENKDRTQYTKIFTDRANAYVNQTLSNGLGETGQSWKKVVDMVSNMNTGLTKGINPSPEEMQQLRGYINQVRMTMSSGLDSIYRAPFGDSGNSFFTFVKPEEAEKIKTQAMQVVEMMERGITDNNWGLVKAAATHLEVMKNVDQANAFKDHPIFRRIKTVESIIGPQAVSTYLMSLPQSRKALIDYTLTNDRLGAFTVNPMDPKSQTALTEDLIAAQKRGHGSPELTKSHIDAWLKEIRSPDKVDDAMLSKLSVYMFGSKNLNITENMSAADRQKFLTQVVTPEVHQRMMKLKTSHPEAYNAYQAWTLSTSQAVISDAVAELSKFNMDRREVMVAWDPKSSRFQMVYNPSAGDRFRTPDGKLDPAAVVRNAGKEHILDLLNYGGATSRYFHAQKALDRLNQTITSIAPIIIDNEQDVGTQMNMLLRGLKAQSISGRTVNDYLLEALTRAQAAVEVQPNEPFREPVNLFQKFAPFKPVWEAPQGLSLGEEQKREINQPVTPSRPLRTEVIDKNPQLATMITNVATELGVDAATAKAIVQIESAGNPNAISPSGNHHGLLQLSDDVWSKYGKGTNKTDPEANLRAGLSLMKDNIAEFKTKYGRDPTATELYLQHQQGKSGFDAHFLNPTKPAWQNMLSTTEGQRRGEQWAKSAIWGNLPQEVRQKFGSVENVTSADFIKAWQDKVEGPEVKTTRFGPFSVPNHQNWRLKPDAPAAGFPAYADESAPDLKIVPLNPGQKGFNLLPADHKWSGVVFHHTAGANLDSALSVRDTSGNGYNFLVDKDGTVYQTAPMNAMTWHAGVLNPTHIGISFVAKDAKDVSPLQEQVGANLAKSLISKGLVGTNVIGHGEANQGKARDEGVKAAEIVRTWAKARDEKPRTKTTVTRAN